MSKVMIIAEAGVNHNGDLHRARHLIDAASDAGADVVKFQTFIAKNLATRAARKADYQRSGALLEESQLEMLKKLELSFEAHQELVSQCTRKKIQFFSTAFDFESFELLDGLNLPFTKVPSGEITNTPFLRRVGAARRPVLLSSGMATLGEIESAINTLELSGTPRDLITVLHCNTQYPTPFADVNLRAMCTIRTAFGVKVGYSDHTQGIEVPVAAVALGASVIEKHFTLDRTLPGPDHAASLEPDELKAMVQSIRNIEIALGDGLKRPSASEIGNREVARKSIVAAQAIRAGESFTERNLTVKRPGSGISPVFWDYLVGRPSARDYEVDELIEW